MPSEIIYNVFVSSTFEDLREERAVVQKSLLQLHCMPIGMELLLMKRHGNLLNAR
jgi:hypothetical protein